MAEGLYNEMIQSKVEPDVVIHGVLINAFADVGSVKEAARNGRFEEATNITRRMRELGLLTDVLSYNNVLGLYAMDGRFREAVSIFREMVSSCVQPDDSTFKSLGSVLVKCGVPKRAVNRLQVTRKKDVQISLQIWLATLSSVVEMYEDEDEDGNHDDYA
ncbi:hypothetical protein F3Y22_tig00112159pilonHSYRG00393 [Hibiscus syriacus]|uniref:Pentatricopeptide repeat-containing protein n=1 Tax=Hibiscus syriacus TaxID=106335 RepID=A0A6A2X5Q5_HIBSY|nr:hypothetical protein F3Y22_tig00112159pilonHSYRG00393 [Hibiscus syriacus]